jgi:putative CocE/NonD family hydrolase
VQPRLPAVLAILLLAGCLGGPGGRDGAECPGDADCPEAPAWPATLAGPFELGSLTTLRVPADDGVDLVGGLWMPDLPDGVKAPVILWQSPYFGACVVHNGPGAGVDPEQPTSYKPFPCQPAADNMALYDLHGRLHVRTLVEAGFAVAAMNVRGTGNSGGCMDPFGARESEDSAFLVEHLGQQPWSNGRVAMAGHSYSGGTPWGAAIRDPPHLKAIVASGLVTDLYTFYHTPQGLASDVHASLLTTLVYENTAPTNPESGDQVGWPGPDRACAEYLARPAEDAGERAGLPRDAAFWEAHRYLPGFADITAAVLVSHGYQESCPFGHCQQDDAIWDLIQAPKRFIVGQWGHDLPPPPDRLENAPFGARWYEDTLVPWLDHWLKGVGPVPPLGVVDWQDDQLEWHRGDHPDSNRSEVLYLDGTSLSAAPGSGSRPLVTTVAAHPCLAPAGIAYGVQVTETTLVQGSPMLFLRLDSTSPRGQFYAMLAVSDAPLGDLACGTTYTQHWLGAVDLRYHAGGYAPSDFPVGEATHVRVDLGSVGLRLEPGQWLSVVLQNGESAPTAEGGALVNVLADGTPTSSHLVLPLAEGGFGGQAPTVAYPQRPFSPEPGPFRFEG